MTDERIYDRDRMFQLPVFPTRQTPSYADWALYEMGRELEEGIDGKLADKQDLLTAGENITIEDGVISATGGEVEFPKLIYGNYDHVRHWAHVVGIDTSIESLPILYIPDYDPEYHYEVKFIDDSIWDGISDSLKSQVKYIRLPSCCSSVPERLISKCGNLEAINLDQTVITRLPPYFFNDSHSNLLVSIDLPFTCTQIGGYQGGESGSFANNTQITRVNLDHIEGIARTAFYNTKIANVKFGSGLSDIGERAFYNCTGITEYVEFPPALKLSNRYCCANWKGLKRIKFAEGCTLTGSYNDMFSGCTALLSVECNNDWYYIAERMFAACTSLKKVDLKDAIYIIAASGFIGCTSLETVKGFENLTLFRHNSFDGCTSLTELSFNGGTTIIEANAFNGCTGVTKVSFGTGFNPETLDASWCNWTFYDSDGTTVISKTDATALAGHTFVGTYNALVKQ